MKTKAKLIAEFFDLHGSEAIREYKLLTDIDRQQLASAIARWFELTQAECDFPLVEY